MTDDRPEIYTDNEAWWPPGQRVPKDQTVDVVCQSCGINWHVHIDLRGSRLQCRCEGWVSVPAATPKQEGFGESAPLLLGRDAPESARPPQPAVISTSRPTSASAAGGELLHASARDRAKWTDRTLIELALMMVAFLVPGVFLMFGTIGDDRAIYAPLAGLATSVLVFLIALASHTYAFEGLRRTAPRYFIEALVATGAALAFAWLWMQLVRSATFLPEMEDPFEPIKNEIGLAMVIFMVGIVPGIFEEIAFRGLVQGRLTVLFGRSQAILITGLAFALAHGGITLAFPIHAGIGIYLCWLRARCGSLLPGMMLHFLYNTTLVVTGM